MRTHTTMGIVVTPAPASVSAQATILDWPAIVVPNLASLERISTDPNNGGPSVMYAGTPYAHIMAPITASTMSARSVK